jgi:inositol transport system ATP-binding protein
MADLVDVGAVRKAFPGVVALDGVSMRVRAGTVHAVVGENGAGKSTLMKIVAGLDRPDAGRVTVRGRTAMIHQELNLLPSMTVAENIWLGREPLTRMGLVDHRALRRRTFDLLAGLGIDIHPDERISDLPIAGRQMVEIARAASCESDILIMDEPTSTLSEREVDHLFNIVADVKARGGAVIYITHRISEVLSIADEVSVLRDGRMVGSEALEGWTVSG